jgi:hypothetical protein
MVPNESGIPDQPASQARLHALGGALTNDPVVTFLYLPNKTLPET